MFVPSSGTPGRPGEEAVGAPLEGTDVAAAAVEAAAGAAVALAAVAVAAAFPPAFTCWFCCLTFDGELTGILGGGRSSVRICNQLNIFICFCILSNWILTFWFFQQSILDLSQMDLVKGASDEDLSLFMTHVTLTEKHTSLSYNVSFAKTDGVFNLFLR